jgi:hypothetical protein
MEAAGLSLVGRALPPAFAAAAVVIAPGGERAFDEADWRDAIVVVESEGVELECRGGALLRLARGDVLWLSGLPLRALHNRAREPALLVAVSRLRTPTIRGAR